jgi:RimJ/RimL family protein N-acetyltransferase
MANRDEKDSSLPEQSKYFLRQWTVTVPSYPSLKYYRATPSHFKDWLPIMSDPKNNELQDTKDKAWDEAAVTKWKEEAETRHNESNIKFTALPVLIEYEGKVVGYGDVWPDASDSGTTSVGVLLNESVRGRGIGKTTIAVLAQLGFDFGLPVTSGTMKANAPMRAVMASLGVPEKEELVTAPGRGVVAEVVYNINRDNWTGIEMKIEFDESK